MKKIILFLAIIVIATLGGTISEATIFDATFPNNDEMLVFNQWSWDGYNHVIINFNNKDFTASAVILDRNGVPVQADFGYRYFWADFYPTYFNFYGSMNGEDWEFISRIYY